MKTRVLLCLLLAVYRLFGAYQENLPTVIEQANGQTINCFASGDEFYNWLHDENGFTIIQSSADGNYYYAVKDKGRLTASQLLVGRDNPASAGLSKNLQEDYSFRQAKSDQFNRQLQSRQTAPKLGILNNIVVLIRFSDQSEFSLPRQAFIDKYNGTLAGTESVRDYYQEVSYGQTNIQSTFYPSCASTINLSVVDPHPRSYYVPYNPVTNPNGYQPNDEWSRRTELLSYALEQIKNQVPADLNIDANNDGYVDNVCFVVRGPHTAWAQLLWAHRSWFDGSVQINGKSVADYTFQPENQNTVRTLCHELFHSLGAPDLYHYTFNGLAPAGCWDIMESGFVHMGAYMKYKYGSWLNSLPVITSSGQYVLKPLTSATNNCYKIAIPGSSDFLLLEYRKQSMDNYEKNLPASGLLVYRIDPDNNGNSNGPPDEVYIFRENGTATINGKIFEAAFCAERQKTEINRYTNPALLTAAGGNLNINIYEIGSAGDSIVFKVDISGQNIPPTVRFTDLVNGDFIKNGILNSAVTAAAYNGATVSKVDFFLDNTLIGSDNSAPYNLSYENANLSAGTHLLEAEVTASNGKKARHQISVKTFNSHIASWFDYNSAQSFPLAFNRGCLPIKVAIDFNLGATDYLAKKIYINIEADPFGAPDVPGQFKCQVLRVNSDGTISETVLADFGTFVSTLNGRYEANITSEAVLNGKIALVMDIDKYQKMIFDQNGVSGHAWLIEPDRPWMDALSRGVIGAPEMGIQLIQKGVDINSDLAQDKKDRLLGSYPNPFNPATKISYELAKTDNVKLVVYNMKGELVQTLITGSQKAGLHSVTFDGSTLSSGIYFCKMQSSGVSRVLKLNLIK